MRNKKLIIIGNESICLKEFEKLVYNYKIYFEDKNIEEVSISSEINFQKAALTLAALSAKCKINISDDCNEHIFKDFVIKAEDLIKTEKKFKINFVGEDDKVAVSFNNEEFTYKELKDLLKKVSKAVKQSDIFYVHSINNLRALCVGFIFPVYLGNLLIFGDEDMSGLLKRYKPNIFVGDKSKIRKLYNLIFETSQNRRIKEFFYGFFKDWDNGILGIFINRFMFFKKFKNLRMIFAEEYTDFKGLWLDFESLGIELYSQRVLMEKETDKE